MVTQQPTHGLCGCVTSRVRQVENLAVGWVELTRCAGATLTGFDHCLEWCLGEARHGSFYRG